MSSAGYDGVTSAQFIYDVSSNFLKVCNTEKVILGGKDAFLYAPLMNTMTLGLYNNQAVEGFELTQT